MPTNMPAPAKAPMDRSRPAMAAPKGKNAALVGIVSLAVGLIAGYGAGRVSTGTPLNPLTASSTKGGSYQDGYDAAKKKIDDAHIFPAAPTEAKSLAGTVESVGAGSFVLTSDLTSANPLEDMSGPKQRTVLVTDATMIGRQTFKTGDQLQKDQERFQTDLQAGKTDATPPNPYTLEKLQLSDLKAGDRVTVTADQNVLPLAEFTATEVMLAGSASQPASPVNIPPIAPPQPPKP